MNRRHDAKDSLAYIPWFWRDWLASTAHAEMSLAEQGAYFNILCRCWGSDRCEVADDDETLARLAGATAAEWARMRSTIRAHLVKTGRGKLSQIRMLSEWRKANDRRKAKRRGALMTNRLRALSAPDSERSRVSAKRSPPSPSPSPSPSPKEKIRSAPLRALPDPGPKAPDSGGVTLARIAMEREDSERYLKAFRTWVEAGNPNSVTAYRRHLGAIVVLATQGAP